MAYLRTAFVFALLLNPLVKLLVNEAAGQDRPLRIGREAEQQFPPLKVPADFRATLFACDPLIEFPSVIALGPRPATLFVANDYVKGMGTQILRRDDIRLLADTDNDGYADQAPVFAEGFHSIQGLEYYDGTLFVMHAPFLTALTDPDRDGRADVRVDLLTGLGLPPEKNPSRLHCANGVVAGHDGWLYLALGDNGCQVPRVEGDVLVVEGGAILRCRPDGSALHVFAAGVRNVYDIALDHQLNVFFRDNENDGGDYMVRICSSFFGADHGYPYLYYERPNEALPPIADLGRGSSAGGVVYRETQFPPQMRGNLFFCEWGRAVMRSKVQTAGSGFADTAELEFAVGDANDPYGFRPTDIVVLRDGSMMVSDWADEQATGRGRARIYHIEYSKPALQPKTVQPNQLHDAVEALNSDSYLSRLDAQLTLLHAKAAGLAQVEEALRNHKLNALGRNHAIWIRALRSGHDSLPALLEILHTDPDPAVRLQAVRAIADIADPVLDQRWLKAGAGDQDLAEQLAGMFPQQPADVQREIITALARLKWYDAPDWLSQLSLSDADQFLQHAAMQLLRHSGNWPAVLRLLDSADSVTRAIALRALAGRQEALIADDLAARLRSEVDDQRRREYADLLTRIHRQPAPWSYWGYRPGPRPANSVDWSHTTRIEDALNELLVDCDAETCLLVLQRMQREKILVSLNVLQHWLTSGDATIVAAAALAALEEHTAEAARPLLVDFIPRTEPANSDRLRAVEMLVTGLDEASARVLLDLCRRVDDGPVLVALIRALPRYPQVSSRELLSERLESLDSDVRAASIDALAALGAVEAKALIAARLRDPEVAVQRAAIRAAGSLGMNDAAEVLDQIAQTGSSELRALCLDALRLLGDKRALPLAVEALHDSATEQAALEYLAVHGNASHADQITQLALQRPTRQILRTAIQALATWSAQEAIAADVRAQLAQMVQRIQGQHAVLLAWQFMGPLTAEDLRLRLEENSVEGGDAGSLDNAGRQVFADAEGGVAVPESETSGYWLARSLVTVDEPVMLQIRLTSRARLHLYVDGQELLQHQGDTANSASSTREWKLPAGQSQVLLAIDPQDTPARFDIELRRQASSVEHEQLIQKALTQTGNAANGRAIFLNTGRMQCLKCHRLADQGESVGPELTGIGSRFSRIHLIEAILTPSRSVGPSFQTVSLVLEDGRVLSGLIVASDENSVTLVDQKSEKHIVSRHQIEEQVTQPTSVMPDGLEKQLMPDEFVDLIEFLTQQQGG